MVKQLPDRDLVAEVGQFREVAPYIVVERQLTLLFKQQQGSRRELFAHGCDIEDRTGRIDGDAVLKVGQAISLLVVEAPVLHDAHGAARMVGMLQGTEQGVDGAMLRVGSGGSSGSANAKCQAQCQNGVPQGGVHDENPCFERGPSTYCKLGCVPRPFGFKSAQENICKLDAGRLQFNVPIEGAQGSLQHAQFDYLILDVRAEGWSFYWSAQRENLGG